MDINGTVMNTKGTLKAQWWKTSEHKWDTNGTLALHARLDLALLENTNNFWASCGNNPTCKAWLDVVGKYKQLSDKLRRQSYMQSLIWLWFKIHTTFWEAVATILHARLDSWFHKCLILVDFPIGIKAVSKSYGMQGVGDTFWKMIAGNRHHVRPPRPWLLCVRP